MIIGNAIVLPGGEPVIAPVVFSENGTYTPPPGIDGYGPVTIGVTARSPRCDQVSTFDFAAERTYMAWMDGTPLPRPAPPPPIPKVGPSVSFSSGTDEELAAIIDGAHAGTIDLQKGEHAWHVGDTRTIHLNAWHGGVNEIYGEGVNYNVSHRAEDLKIAITSFKEYMDCGNVLQFDFIETPNGSLDMLDHRGGITNVGGYSVTKMYTTVCPAMAEAMPDWIKTRLKTFSVRVSVGNDSSTIETVTGNKLALRSEVEIFGATTYSKPGEGSQIEYYRTEANRIKVKGETGNPILWWDRSPYYTYGFCLVTTMGAPFYHGMHSGTGYAPFGCL